MNRSWSSVPRPVGLALVGVGLFVGLTATLLAGATGLLLFSLRLGVVKLPPLFISNSTLTFARHRARANRRAVEDFVADKNYCPATQEELVAERYLDRANMIDPWGTPIIFRCATTTGDTNVTARSAGPDGAFGTADDVVTRMDTGAKVRGRSYH